MATPPFTIDETAPADDDIVSQFPANERTNRDNIKAWLVVDHDTSGRHNKATMPVQVSDPTTVAGIGYVYTKTVSGQAELFYKDSAGNVLQLTTGGEFNMPTVFAPSGTKMLFQQTAAPSLWTKDTTNNDKMMRVVSGTVASGGSWTITGLTLGTMSVAGHALTIAEMPAHTHPGSTYGGVGASTGPFLARGDASTGSTSAAITQGGGATHTHGLSGVPGADGTWRPAYVDCIVATKD